MPRRRASCAAGAIDTELASACSVSRRAPSAGGRRHSPSSPPGWTPGRRSHSRTGRASALRDGGRLRACRAKILVGEAVESSTTSSAYPPDTVACIFWLKNRDPKDWRDKQEIEVPGLRRSRRTSCRREEACRRLNKRRATGASSPRSSRKVPARPAPLRQVRVPVGRAGDDLEHLNGPRTWQRETLEEIGAALQALPNRARRTVRRTLTTCGR
jgi:hypothetical protein